MKEKIINAKQLALILSISEITVKKLAKTGELPCTFFNRRPQFNLDVLMKYFCQLEGGAA
jgi:hypothetical protein